MKPRMDTNQHGWEILEGKSIPQLLEGLFGVRLRSCRFNWLTLSSCGLREFVLLRPHRMLFRHRPNQGRSACRFRHSDCPLDGRLVPGQPQGLKSVQLSAITLVGVHFTLGEIGAAAARALPSHFSSDSLPSIIATQRLRLIETDVWIKCIWGCPTSSFLLHANTNIENLVESYSGL